MHTKWFGDSWRDLDRWAMICFTISITAYLVALVGTIVLAFQAGWGQH